MSTLRLTRLCALGSLAVALPSMASAALLNDTFADNERSTQNLPASAAWHFGSNGTSASASATTGALVLSQGSTTGATVAVTAYFAPLNNPQALSIVGSSITLTFDMAYTEAANVTHGFRFGLFNSGGNRLTTDVATNNGQDNAYDTWTGYSVWRSLGTASATGLSVRERSGAFDNAAESPIGTAQSAELASAASSATSPGTFTGNSLTITRTSTGVTLSATVAGSSITNVVDNAAANLNFDAVHFWFNGGAVAPTGTLDNVTITYVPEPGLVGLATCGVLALLGRRARNSAQ
jgi:hypothetical protein